MAAVLITLGIVGFLSLFVWTIISGERRHREERRVRKAVLRKLDEEPETP